MGNLLLLLSRVLKLARLSVSYATINKFITNTQLTMIVPVGTQLAEILFFSGQPYKQYVIRVELVL